MFAVGDDDQSIYAFRGARVGNMADFEREYRVRRVDQARAELPQLRPHPGRRQRPDRAQRAAPGQEPAHRRRRRRAGARVRGHQRLRRGAVVAGRGAAAAPRRHAAQRDRACSTAATRRAACIESALFNAGVPYRVYGGLRFFERAEVKHALAYLRLLENPNDDTSFLRVVNFPTRGIGARSIEQLQDAARASGRSLYAERGRGGGQGRRQPAGLRRAGRRHARRPPTA